MIGKRYIDGDELLASVDGAATGVRSRITSWLKLQPTSQKLIGRQRAAQLLGVGSPYMTHFIKAGEVTAIPVEGGKDAYDEAEILKLAKRRRKAKEAEEDQ